MHMLTVGSSPAATWRDSTRSRWCQRLPFAQLNQPGGDLLGASRLIVHLVSECQPVVA